jgi:tetratricopeptide (TPR) repeat protein
MNRPAQLLGTVALCLTCVWAGGCATDPAIAKQKAFESGNGYFERGDYRAAVVQFRVALQHDPLFGEARYKLAEAYTRQSDLRRALPEYVRAADLLSGSVEVQLKAAQALLLAGRYEDARARAEKGAAIDPTNVDIQLMIGNAIAGLKDLDQAALTIEAAATADGTRGYPYSNLGTIEMVRGNNADAEAAFRKAISIEPKSVAARLGLANFLRATGHPPEAEQTVKDALAIDSKHLFANQFMAAFYIDAGRPAEAERYVRVITDIRGDARSRLALVDYYAASRRFDEALRLLPTVNSDPADRAMAAAVQVRTAEIAFAQARRADAHAAIDVALKAEPPDPAAVLLKARLLAEDGRFDDALVRAASIRNAAAVSAEAHLLIGQIEMARKKLDEAIAEFYEALRQQPRATRVRLALANAHLVRGDAPEAIALAGSVLEREPGNLEARVFLVRGLTMRGEVNAAARELAAVPAAQRANAAVQVATGALALTRDSRAEAGAAFERAEAFSTQGTESLAGLVSLDLKAGRLADARRRVEARRERDPMNAQVAVMAGEVYMAGKQSALAIKALQRAIELDPSQVRAYVLLARLYIGEGNLDEARRKFEEIAPLQPRSVGAPTMAAMILHLQGRVDEAEQRYQDILAQDPNAAVAANNQAWLYAERGEQLDVALQLAQTAKAKLPNVAEVSSTLGWVLYKKNQPDLAIHPLVESTQQDPTNPVYRYRLGLAYLGAGNEVNARRELQAALKMNARFQYAAHARELLSELE